MKKKFLAKLLAVSMAVTMMPALPGMEAGADAEELNIASQEISGGYLDLTKSSRAATLSAVTMDTEYDNPFAGQDTSKGVEIEFTATGTKDDEVLGTIFSINRRNTSGHFYFTPATYLGYNADDNLFDANLKNYGCVENYLASGGRVNIKITPDGFEVKVNNELCYDQTIVDDPEKGMGNFTDYSKVLSYLAEEDNVLRFGKGSWWADVKATVTVTDFVCKLVADPEKDLAFRQKGEDWLDCPGWWTAHTKGYKVGEDGTLVTFKSQTYSGFTDQWACPLLVVYKGNENKVGGEGYDEYAVIRGDGYAWTTKAADANTGAGIQAWNSLGYTFSARGIPDGVLFNESNRAGVSGEASAVIKDSKILVKLSVNGVTEFVSIPYDGEGNVYFSLLGQDCTLFDITESAFTEITIPAGIATYPVILPTATPAPTLPPAGEDNSEGLELDCEGWWKAHTSGMEVTSDGVALTFKNITYSSATDNWNIPIVIAYSGDEAKVDGAGYNEYVVIRGDAYAWTTKAADANTAAGLAAWNNLGYTFQSNASSWDTWVADNKAGTDCKVQAVNKDGKVIIETTVGSVTSYTTFPVEDGKKVYISLSGEKCKLTNIKSAQYTAINVPGEVPSATATPAPTTEPSETPAPGTTPAPGATAEPGTTPAPGTTVDPGTQTPGTTDTPEEPSNEDNKKKTMKVSGITAKPGKKKVTGTVSVKAAKVKVKVGNKKYKNAKVSGKKFTFTASSKLKKGTKVTIKVTKSGYKTVTKSVKVK